MEWQIGVFILSRVDAFVRFLFLVLWDTIAQMLASFVLWPVLAGGVGLLALLLSRRAARARLGAIRDQREKASRP